MCTHGVWGVMGGSGGGLENGVCVAGPHVCCVCTRHLHCHHPLRPTLILFFFHSVILSPSTSFVSLFFCLVRVSFPARSKSPLDVFPFIVARLLPFRGLALLHRVAAAEACVYACVQGSRPGHARGLRVDVAGAATVPSFHDAFLSSLYGRRGARSTWLLYLSDVLPACGAWWRGVSSLSCPGHWCPKERIGAGVRDECDGAEPTAEDEQPRHGCGSAGSVVGCAAAGHGAHRPCPVCRSATVAPQSVADARSVRASLSPLSLSLSPPPSSPAVSLPSSQLTRTQHSHCDPRHTSPLSP
jgi:hypothetical protein